MSILSFVELAAEIACLLMLARIALIDFQTMRVSNKSNLILLITYMVWLMARDFEAFDTDLMVGALLFCVALVMWLLKALGAGDVKLYFTLGLLLGVETALVYVVALLIVSTIVLFAFKTVTLESEGKNRSGVKARLLKFQRTGKIPYAVVMVASAAIPLSLRFFVIG